MNSKQFAGAAVSRREALRMGLAGAATLGVATPALADAPLAGVARPQGYRFKLGAFEVATVNDGFFQLDGPHPIFGENQSADAVAALMQDNFLPTNRLEIGFAPVLINTGAELILLDTGNGAARGPTVGGLAGGMADLGYSPEQVDVVMITHFHPDHIAGMTTDGAPTYPNARYVASRMEFDWWRANSGVRGDDYKALLDANVFAFADQFSFLEDGQEIATGVTGVAAFGHTPGHMIVHIESEGRRLMVTSDTANHYIASLRRPDWHVRFDMDKDGAVAARKRVFDMLAADKIPFAGYHMPFPSVGYVSARPDEGYDFVPASYQLNL